MKPALTYDQLAAEKNLRQGTIELRRPPGRRRDCSILGVFNDALRHRDGALTVGYEVEMPATMFLDDGVIDYRYDELARMLAFDKPARALSYRDRW